MFIISGKTVPTQGFVIQCCDVLYWQVQGKYVSQIHIVAWFGGFSRRVLALLIHVIVADCGLSQIDGAGICFLS